MGPPTGGRVPVVDDIRPPQPERRGQSVQHNVTVNRQFDNLQTRFQTSQDEQSYHPVPEQQHAQQPPPQQTHSSNNPPQTRTRPPPPQHDTQFQDHRINNPTPNISAQYPTDYPQNDQHDHQATDSPDGPRHSHVNVTVDVCTEQEVCDSTPDLLTTFIVGRMERDGYAVPPALSSRNRKRESDIAHVLRDIGDDIMKNYQLNHYISEIEVTPNTVYKTFASVAEQIFADGSVNWGRIVMLFYFAYKLALQVLNQLPLIEVIIGWVKRFVTDRLATWISSRGGWNAIREYYQSSNAQMFGMFVAGFLVASCLFWYLKKK